MTLESLIDAARRCGASDLHLEPGLPAAFRIRGDLQVRGEPLQATKLMTAAKDLLGDSAWSGFLERLSADYSGTIAGVRCRINILKSARGVGFAIRLLSTFQPTLAKLNLHPDLRKLVERPNGLILVSGPTGSGKTSTLAALIQEINLVETRHIVTIENPVEYGFVPHRAYIRQREVGRDTPSFDQALLDALREDPDVLMVGEMRHPQTMRLTLNAAETGHLVLSTVHSSNVGEALQRIVSAFPAEIQAGVCAQLADSLTAVICQRLDYRPDLKIRIPELEILTATTAARNLIRQGNFFKLQALMETSHQDGMWTLSRYRRWLDSRHDWTIPSFKTGEKPDTENKGCVNSTPLVLPEAKPATGVMGKGVSRPGPVEDEDIIIIQPPEENLQDIISQLDD